MHSTKNKLDKVVIIGGSNNVGFWGRISQPPEVNGGSGAESPTLRRFLQFFHKKYAFLSILWSKFLLKNTFKMTAKSVVLLRPQRLRHRARAPTCYATADGYSQIPCLALSMSVRKKPVSLLVVFGKSTFCDSFIFS